jgi:protein SCO1/2
MSGHLRLVVYAVWGVLVAALVAAALAVSQPAWFARQGETASSVAIGGPFTLTDQNGRRVTDQDFLGKPTAYFFGFTHCPDVCPTTLLDMGDLLKALGRDGDKFNVVFVSLDPQRDTPALLKVYLESFDPRITAATGTQAEIEDVAKKFRVYFRKVGEGDNYSIDHSTAVYLMDSKGVFVSLIGLKEAKGAALDKMRRALAS